MERIIRLLAISGSVRRESTNSLMLRYINRFLDSSCSLVVYEGIDSLPIFNPDLEGDLTPDSVKGLGLEIGRSDGLLVASPEYAHGIPGGIKNAFDWMVSRNELIDKPVLLLHASQRGDFAISAMSEVLRTVTRCFDESPVVRLPLTGLGQEEASRFMSQLENTTEIRAAVAGFTASIREFKKIHKPMLKS